MLRDLNTGQVSALDLTTLQVSAVMPTTPGLGVSVALAGETAFVIDGVQGQIRQLDPRSLAPIGDSITLPHGIVPGGFDGKGTLWVGVPTEGTVVAITPGASGASPKVVRTITVADPGHDLVLSTLDDGVAVLDNTEQELTIVRGDRTHVTAGADRRPGRHAGPYHRQRGRHHGRRPSVGSWSWTARRSRPLPSPAPGRTCRPWSTPGTSTRRTRPPASSTSSTAPASC